MIPLGTDRALRRPTLVTPILIGLCVIIYGVQVVMARGGDVVPPALERFVLTPGKSAWYSYITAAFLHGGFMHIFGNLLTLYVFGPAVEDRLGRLGFLGLYLAGAVGASALHAFFVDNPVIGASGAIAAVTGAFMVMFPRCNIRVFSFFIIIGLFTIPALWFIGIRIAYDFLLTGAGRSGNVATVAHLGGYGMGIGVAMLVLWLRWVPREATDLFTSAKQAVRRREFLEAQNERRRDQERRARAAAAEPVATDALAVDRAAVTHALGEPEAARLIEAYRGLVQRHRGPAAVLPRRTQYDVANALFKAGSHELAFSAYDGFATAYPADPELPQVRAMLGLIAARYLNDPERATRELRAAMEKLPDGPHKDLARTVLVELGVQA